MTVRLLLALMLASAAAARLLADEPATAPTVRPDLHVDRSRFPTDAPITLRLSLVNSGDAAVEIPAAGAAGAAVGLTTSGIFGTQSKPSLFIRLNDEIEETLRPQGGLPPSADAAAVALGPGAIIGAAVELTSLSATLRYPGVYRVEWTPFEGRYGAARAEFRIEARRDAVVVTDLGKVTFRLFYDEAPLNVENFLELADAGFYNGKTFHRVISGFLIQGGCPRGDGGGARPDDRRVVAEFRDYPVDAGTLMMARKPSDPDSASAQFFVALARLPELDRQYTVIGQADDPASMQTLGALGGAATDRQDRPIAPLVIRSVRLVDSDGPRAKRVESLRPIASPPSSASQPAASPAPGQLVPVP